MVRVRFSATGAPLASDSRWSSTDTSSPLCPSAKTGVNRKPAASEAGASMGVKQRPATASMAITSPTWMARPPRFRMPAPVSGRLVITMLSSLPEPSTTKSASEKEMGSPSGPFLEMGATVDSSVCPKKKAEAGSWSANRKAASTARGRARRRRARCFKSKTSLFGCRP